MSEIFDDEIDTPEPSDQGFERARRFEELKKATKPCTDRTQLFFGGHNEYEDGERGGPRKEQILAAEVNSRRARRLCMQCPLALMRTCAEFALFSGDSFGVWAGVQLPGNQTRKLPLLIKQRELLTGIADGTIDPYTHESNDDLFESHGDEQLVLFPEPTDRAPAATTVTAVRASA
ncbi:WhiB family transcriptional regulator [Mycolicibacterium llatzerense]|uniref:WhiB family transcriptional regulator n=1 Tax=Mycolicibacterium llatzerense TaxID=280871 RepID=UPI0021B60F5A|nr:WhiB family transcriptional regulator [Mycolicibacterium llatzerense]MCT7373007.1 hypothetical protein [Mycolicibacterium llatzerense]